MQRFTILLLFTLVPACQPAFINGVPNERSPYFEVPVDSKLILNQAITIEPAQKSAYFQRGRKIPWYDVDKFSAYCALALERARDAEQTVKPGEFQVHRVFNETLFKIAKSNPTGVTTVDFKQQRAQNMRDDGGMTYEVLATVMELRSNTQPEVRRMTCANWIVPQSRLSLTVEIIRRSLGDFFSLKLAI